MANLRYGVALVLSVTFALIGGGLASCSSTSSPAVAEEDGGPDATTASAVTSQAVGSSGGTVTTPQGVSIVIPPGALPSSVTITVQTDPAAPAPAGVQWVGVPLNLGPEGTKFAVPISITLPIAAGALPAGKQLSDLIVFTAPQGSTAYTPLPTSVVDSTHIRATTTHFSTVASAPTCGEGGTCQPEGDAEAHDATGTALEGGSGPGDAQPPGPGDAQPSDGGVCPSTCPPPMQGYVSCTCSAATHYSCGYSATPAGCPSASGGPPDGGGVSGPDQACVGASGGCIACCQANHPTGSTTSMVSTCLCGASVCESQCATSLCATPSSAPMGGACSTCIAANESTCAMSQSATCHATPDCVAYLACTSQMNCSGGPTDAGGPGEGGSGPGGDAGGPLPEAGTFYSIGGTVSGLVTSPADVLQLQNTFGSGGPDYLSIMANGPFTFNTPVQSGQPYDVTVRAQPLPIAQTCVVSGGSGVATASVANVVITCTAAEAQAPPSYVIAAQVFGLTATDTLVLQDNGGDTLSVTSTGGPSTVGMFATPVPLGQSYDVTVLTQPGGGQLLCASGMPSGIVMAAGTTVVFQCSPNPFWDGG